MASFKRLEDLDVYQRLCRLHLDVCDVSHAWPAEERYELGSQARRSSNSSPAQLAEKHDDRHLRNKIEGVNRSRGEAGETIHHLYMARLKGYLTRESFDDLRARYQECVRMLNGLERALEQNLPPEGRRWPSGTHEAPGAYDAYPLGYPEAPPYPPGPDDLPPPLSPLNTEP